MYYTNLTDFEIWAYFKKGDQLAFSFIYNEYSEALYHYGLKFTSNNTLVEDALQDLFVGLLKNRKNLGDTDNILLYLLKSFKHKLSRKIKKENKYQQTSEIEDYEFGVSWSIQYNIILQEDFNQKHNMLLKALNRLSPRQKEAIYLRFNKELDYVAVADIMDINVESCRNLISKAILKLRNYIKDKGLSSRI